MITRHLTLTKSDESSLKIEFVFEYPQGPEEVIWEPWYLSYMRTLAQRLAKDTNISSTDLPVLLKQAHEIIKENAFYSIREEVFCVDNLTQIQTYARNEQIYQRLCLFFPSKIESYHDINNGIDSATIGRIFNDLPEQLREPISSSLSTVNLPNIKLKKLPSAGEIWSDYRNPSLFEAYSSDDIQIVLSAVAQVKKAFAPVIYELVIKSSQFLDAEDAQGKTYAINLRTHFREKGNRALFIAAYTDLEANLIVSKHSFDPDNGFDEFKSYIFNNLKQCMIPAVIVAETYLPKTIKKIFKRTPTATKIKANWRAILTDFYANLYCEEQNGLFKIQNLLQNHLKKFPDETVYEFNNRLEKEFRHWLFVAFAIHAESFFNITGLVAEAEHFVTQITSMHGMQAKKDLNTFVQDTKTGEVFDFITEIENEILKLEMELGEACGEDPVYTIDSLELKLTNLGDTSDPLKAKQKSLIENLLVKKQEVNITKAVTNNSITTITRAFSEQRLFSKLELNLLEARAKACVTGTTQSEILHSKTYSVKPTFSFIAWLERLFDMLRPWRNTSSAENLTSAASTLASANDSANEPTLLTAVMSMSKVSRLRPENSPSPALRMVKALA